MAGHSHWAGIKHKKAANDAKRGKVWSKIARMIIVAAKAGGGDPGQNLTLRYAIDKGKAANMPKDTIEKAIKKGTGELGAIEYVDVLYEGYAPGGWLRDSPITETGPLRRSRRYLKNAAAHWAPADASAICSRKRA
ncbi:MAG: transcriptional regulator family protein [Planctomycetota bacterium]|jgi:transcriptional/translational regulatory protein YebC/TACO1